VNATITSAFVPVTVNWGPSGTISPSSVTLDIGQPWPFSTTVSGGTPPFIAVQLYVNGTAVPTGSIIPYITLPPGFYTVYLKVTDAVGVTATSNTATLRVNPAPSVTVSPSSVVMDVGQSQLFTSSVSGGTSPYSYQWYLNGSVASGATNASWTFKPLSMGSYSVRVQVTDAVGGTATSNDANVTVVPPVMAISGSVGITGYKLVFKEVMNNSLGSQAIINYYWSFSVEVWNGTQWFIPRNGTHVLIPMSGLSIPFASYAIPNSTIISLYYVYVLNSSGMNAVSWGEWLKISFTFHWTYSGNSYSTNYAEELNVHPGDIAGAALVTFPYLGADGVVNINDVFPIATNWLQTVSPGTNPMSTLARADIIGQGVVNINDVFPIAENWLATWTNTPPPG
jgi:hypothetical protein